MPKAPLYAHRLAETIAQLARLSDDWIDRRTLAEIMGVSKWTAWRIFRQCGASEGPGRALVCRREDLVRRLQEMIDGSVAPELARRDRLESQLGELLQFASRKRKYLARDAAALELLSTRFSRLPAGVDLTPGELRIAFYGTEDFLQKFGAVVFALQNDLERIEAFIEHGRI